MTDEICLDAAPTASGELSKTYEPQAFEAAVTRRWLESRAFAATPDERPPQQRYVIMMPLPNVTGALHMGHAMDNVMQDLLVRWHRMQGDNTLWMAGTDHAGIATQAVVEKRLKELEGKTRHDIGREALVARIWAWKDEYQERIVRQQQSMGCSCDWERQRFTMDAVCSAAVREAFFLLFRDRLIHRGYRLVNWDCHLQTAVADDEVYHDTVQGHFWHLRYAVLEPQPGEPEYVVVATTRPETMLGDTAVAVHPAPAAALDKALRELQARLEAAPARERAALEAERDRLLERRATHLPRLERLAAMARSGRKLLLPLMEREIPLILDEWAKPELGSGCVKITPAHDPNDYQVWQRHKDRIGIVNILEPDGTLNDHAGRYARQDRFEARRRVVEDLESLGLLEQVEEREVEIGHSDRSKTPVEPFLSKQWWVRMGDVEGGVVLGRGTKKQRQAAGLAQAAIDACREGWRSPSGLTLRFHPDGERYRGTYVNWLAEKRDWCISRQLWWGHRIPVWWASYDDPARLRAAVAALPRDPDGLHAWISDPEGRQLELEDGLAAAQPGQGPWELQVCLRSKEADERHGPALQALRLTQDPDVLDTWFSSALWPFSTLGWPDPAKAQLDPGQAPLTGPAGECLPYYYPGSCLVTGRDIITLWVARMVLMGLYTHGDLPFKDVFIHAKIMDGKGVTMSKSKGNGIDPVDIIERYGADAMRYVICDMQTGMQDIRLPVQAECPNYAPGTHQKDKVELAEAKHGRTIFTYLCPECGQEFDVLGTMAEQGVPPATIVSDRFEVGRAFCNKLWNAARFALMNVGELGFRPLALHELALEDRWILSRLARAAAAVQGQLQAYNPSAALAAVREFFWSELCDWYLELIKPGLKDPHRAPVARQVLAFALDHVLRLLHPFVPFVTEVIWERLQAQAPMRGITRPAPAGPLLTLSAWPVDGTAFQDPAAEAEVALLQELARGFRDLRAKYGVAPGRELEGRIKRLPELAWTGRGAKRTLTRGAPADLDPPSLSGGKAVRLQGYASLDGRCVLWSAPHPGETPEEEGERLHRELALLEHLRHQARLSRLEVGARVDKPRNAAVQVQGEAELYLADVLDPAKERERLEKQKEKLAGQLTASEKKLQNANFTAKAPPEVVEAERVRLQELQGQLALIEQSMASLQA